MVADERVKPASRVPGKRLQPHEKVERLAGLRPPGWNVSNLNKMSSFSGPAPRVVQDTGHLQDLDKSIAVTVDVTHETAATLTVTGATVTVNEVQITGLTGAGATQTINEAGTTAAITGLATFTDPAAVEPNATVEAEVKPVPMMRTLVPPVAGPVVGLRPVTVGIAT